MIASGRRILVALGLLAVSAGLTGCGTMGTPVLRHETGEPLGKGRIRGMAYLQTNRTLPLVAGTHASAAIEQQASVFQSGGFGLLGTVGVSSKIDLQLGGAFSAGGGGWRSGVKYQALKIGKLAVAGMVGYGAYAGSGDVRLDTDTGSQDVRMTLSGKMFELGAPVSFRFSQAFAVYSGLTYFRLTELGRTENSAVDGDSDDWGMNLGMRITFGRFDTDIEAALVRQYDPFMTRMTVIPYLGVAFGITF